MSSRDVETVYFNDGCVKEGDYVYIAAKLHSVSDEYHFARTFFHKGGQWKYHDLEWRVESVCYYSEQDAFYTLSVNADVGISTPKGFEAERIPEAGVRDGLAAVNQIRQIGKRLYVCGDQGQVYRREDSGWVHFDEGLLDRNVSASALCLNSIDGSSDEDIYVVADHGRIFHFDGSQWSELDTPTNQHLERVRCVNSDEFYICGKNGVFFKGSPNGFEDFSVGGMKEYFWGLEHFEDKVYLAALKGLFVFDGTSVEPLATGLEPEIGGYRLSARKGMLWSFGVDDLASFNGKEWTRLKHPDNP
jgi:hypothetical protein